MSESRNNEREIIVVSILDFAREHKLKIHPGQEPVKWADLLIKRGGHCPCVRDRDHCPCEFVLEDIKESNLCRCGLFCNDAYIKEYNRLVVEPKLAKKWKRKQGKGF